MKGLDLITIAVFVGSLRRDSLNRTLAKSLESYMPADVKIEYVDFASVPLYNQDLEEDYPQAALDVKQQVAAADGILFVTPEYNRSIPGALKNVIDWISRPSSQNPLVGKPAAVIGISGGMLGTALAQSQLRSVLLYLDTLLIGQPEVYVPNGIEVFDNDGKPNDRVSEKLKEFAERFSRHVKDNR